MVDATGQDDPLEQLNEFVGPIGFHIESEAIVPMQSVRLQSSNVSQWGWVHWPILGFGGSAIGEQLCEAPRRRVQGEGAPWGYFLPQFCPRRTGGSGSQR